LSKFFEELFKWFKETFPTALAVGGVVYGWMLDRLRKEEKAHDKTRLEKKLVENELEVEREFSGMSDRDVINSVVNGGKTPPDGSGDT